MVIGIGSHIPYYYFQNSEFVKELEMLQCDITAKGHKLRKKMRKIVIVFLSISLTSVLVLKRTVSSRRFF